MIKHFTYASDKLTAFHTLFVAATAGSAVLIAIQIAIVFNWLPHSGFRTSGQLNLGNILLWCGGFVILAFIGWCYIRKKERALASAKQTEIVLLEQKKALKIQSKRYVGELRQMQLEEMQQMYHFAELGQHGVTLLHDLAGYLTALKLEVETLQSGPHAQAIIPTQQIVQHLDTMVEKTYGRLHGDCQKRKFNIIGRVDETIVFLQTKAFEAHAEIDWHPPAHSWVYMGDGASLCQVIAILMNNAIDAYSISEDPGVHRVVVTMQRVNTHFIIRVSDWGKGIPVSEQKYLFQPFRSTKKSGLGLGLYIARRIIEMQFSGTLELEPSSDHTEFIIKLPRVRQETIL